VAGRQGRFLQLVAVGGVSHSVWFPQNCAINRLLARLRLKALSEICVRSSDQSRAFWLSEIWIQISDVIAFKQLILDRLRQSPSGQVWTPVDSWA
jgi:hypothetical protein